MPYHQDWDDDHDGLSADRDDAAPDWLRERQRPRHNATGRFATVLGVLALFGVGLYHLADRHGFEQWIASAPHGLAQTGPAVIALSPIDLNEPADPYPIPQQLDPIAPNDLTSAPMPADRPLADCIRPGNVIDENVINCRYGELPRSYPDSAASGMVTPEYLARYKAEQASRSSAPSRPSAERDVTAKWIPKWDGNGQFLAEWQSLGNRIDSSSVCANHRRGSIDYRECRKAAKVHFREQCRAWEKRWDHDREDHSKRMEQRYCSAANGFSPMG